MKPNTIKTSYWITTVIFALMALMDGIGGVTRQQAGIDVMNHLGYPVYFLSIVGVAKLLGAAAILQTRFRAIKEWAYAGFAFNFIGAFASRAFMGDPTFEVIFPIIMLAVMFVPYYFWKKYEQVRYAIA
ncbi:DoxX family protein [Chitinophaga deserti]|uniref:DoxX family protein n=1 Tax=Chitinophaga deserti TaxID=2164099 RepID=UPI000D6BF099|nr:DoxX family protein [Chitinophaga deserti]